MSAKVQKLKDGFFPVPAKMYKAGDIIGEDLHLHYQGNFILYRPQNLLWRPEDEVRLVEFGVDELFIKCGNPKDHQRFIEAHLTRILEEPGLPLAKKASLLHQASQQVVEDIFEKPQSAENHRRAVSYVKTSIDFLGQNPSHFIEFMKLATTSFSEFTHAVQVSATAVALAERMGFKTFNELSAIGVGALLHDIGKVNVDRSILEKEGALTENEYKILQKHPQWGYEMVKAKQAVPPLAEQIILEHHERENGLGYPKRSKEPHFFSRIVGLVDCFDAMTSTCMGTPDKPLNAFRRLQSELKNEFDQKLVVEFIKLLKG